MKVKLFSTLLVLLPSLAIAADPGDEAAAQQVTDALRNITDLIFTLFMAGAVIAVLISAWRFLTSGGDPEKAKGAKMMLLYAVIAIAIALLANAIPFAIESLIISGGSEVGDHVPAQQVGDGIFVR